MGLLAIGISAALLTATGAQAADTAAVDTNFISWLALAAAAISNGLTVWNFVQSPSRAANTAIAKLAELVTGQEKRIQSLEGELKHLPSKDAVTDLRIALAKIEGTVGRLEERLRPISNTVEHIDTFLRERGES